MPSAVTNTPKEQSQFPLPAQGGPISKILVVPSLLLYSLIGRGGADRDIRHVKGWIVGGSLWDVGGGGEGRGGGGLGEGRTEPQKPVPSYDGPVPSRASITTSYTSSKWLQEAGPTPSVPSLLGPIDNVDASFRIVAAHLMHPSPGKHARS